MAGWSLELLLNALSDYRTCYVLGAGASAPQVPPMRYLSDRIAAYAPRLGSFAVSVPDSPLRRLIASVIDDALTTSSLDKWKAGAMTTATIALVLQDIISAAHFIPLPQYAAFQLVPRTATIVSFNWDGLAWARCHQRVLCPHGTLGPRFHTPLQLDELLDDSQLYDSDDARDWIVPGLVMPGEEDGKHLAEMRDKVLKTWLEARQVVVIGYSFGIGSPSNYDRVWLDAFVEALQTNQNAAVHIVDPDAARLRGELVERLKRTVNVHAYPVSWYGFSTALLAVAAKRGCTTVAELRSCADDILSAYQSFERRLAAAV